MECHNILVFVSIITVYSQAAQTANNDCDGPRICTLEYNPICGSEWQTYGNLCQFNLGKCDIPDLEIESYGECPANGLHEECLDCRLVRLAGCTDEQRDQRCENCNTRQVCCDNCCGGQSCLARREKVGRCPPRQLRPCIQGSEDDVEGCDYDAQCKGAQKCCPGVCTQTCQNPIVCELPLVVGPCEALINRWGYSDGTCTEFTYGGCDGNGNNFQTLEECQNTCGGLCPDGSQQVNCFVDPCQFSSCNAYPAATCESNYCGCNAVWYFNENIVNCDENICELPLDVGTCDGTYDRFGYKRGRCRKFVYGGCEGNANNFRTKKGCRKACKSNKSPSKCINCEAIAVKCSADASQQTCGNCPVRRCCDNCCGGQYCTNRN